MSTDEGIRWWSVRPWELWFWRWDLWTVLAGCPVVTLMSAIEKEWPLVVFMPVACLLAWRFGRTITLQIGVLPDAIVVRRALSFGLERLPINDIKRCVTWRRLAREEAIVLYQTEWWRPPIVMVTGPFPPMGYPYLEWGSLKEALRSTFEPIGKWQKRPWWRPGRMLL